MSDSKQNQGERIKTMHDADAEANADLYEQERGTGELGLAILQGVNIALQDYMNDMTCVVIGPLELGHAMAINDALKEARKMQTARSPQQGGN